MLDKIIYFFIGVIITGFCCVYYFSPEMMKANQYRVNDFQNKLSLYKGVYSTHALPLIKANNNAVKQLVSEKHDDESIQLARTLLASSLLLNEMTLQNTEIKKDVFITAMFFYGETESGAVLEGTISLLETECKRNFIMPDCSREKIKELLDMQFP